MIVRDDLGVPALASGVQKNMRAPFDNDHISVTELLDSPRIRLLKRQHWKSLEVPLSEQIWSFLGSSTHAMLEAASHGGEALVEQRLSVYRQGLKLSGQLDLYEDGILSDFKITSVWSVVLGNGERVKKWEQQLNVYAHLLREHGHAVNSLRVIAIFRDWSPSKAGNGNPDYPSSKVKVIPLPLWPEQKTLSLIDERLALHIDAEGRLPECTAEERWADADTWAVMKAGQARAMRVLDSPEAAVNWRAVNGGAEVVKRTGGSRRCQSYCPVSGVCSQWQAMNARS